MYTVYFDSGTTNTRMYVLDVSGTIVFTSKKAVGSKDAVLANDSQFLARELNQLYIAMLENLHLEDADISSIWMSGMVTSKNGIVEVPYAAIPVSLPMLVEKVFTYYEPDFFRRNIQFIPGIKSMPENLHIDISNIDQVNNMRGEETEIMGILSRGMAKEGTCIIVLPGSHTQIAILENGSIVNIISTITGELFRAIKERTILSASLETTDAELDSSMVILGYKNLIRYGFNRALYIVRSLMLFTSATASQRASYLEGVLNGGVLQSIQAVMGEKTQAQVFISGTESQYRIFSAIAGAFYPELTIRAITAGSNEPFSVLGFRAIAGAYARLH